MINDLVNAYYDGIAHKAGWEKPLSDTIRFVSPGGKVTEGKSAFIQANTRFLGGVKSARRKEMLIDGETACVWMSYDVVSPQGKETTLDALEIWQIKDNLLDALTIYFDTAAFRKFMQAA